MKQLLFLLLFPCLALAQYTGNGNQKITLGEQTTADGLVYRGIRADTASKIVPFSDTSAYIILDTVEKTLWLYKAGQVPKWQQVGGSSGGGGVDSTAIAYVNSYGTQTVNGAKTFTTAPTFSTALLGGSGGTGITTFGAATRIPYAASTTALTTTNKFTFDPTGNKLIIGKNDSLDSNPNFTINLSGSDAPSPILGFRLYNTTLNKVSLFRYDNNHSFIFTNNDSDNGLGSHRFKIGSGNGEEILTITRPTASGTDGRVGIGTTSPTEKLHVVGNGLFTGSVTATRFNPTANTATGTGMFAPTSTSLGFSTSGTNRMTLDASGNFGLGVTPYSTTALIKSFDFNTTGGFGSYSNSTNTQFTYLSSNAYLNTGVNWAYKFTGVPASTFIQNNGEYQWFTAASGTADNVISFTQVMTLDNSGDLGIGTASPAVQFHTTSNVRFAGLASITDLRTDADGDLFNGSDFNLKNSIDTINFGLSDVLKLKPVSFNWNDEARNINEYKSMGFIAQDIMNVIPNAASTMGDGDMQVDYNAIVATLTKAIQEQQALIKALEQRILILENK